jgi:predicted TIM-barrel fold metal-dependent hydrolase
VYVTQYQYISADNHLDPLWTPKDVWQNRVAARFRDRAPKVVESTAGTVWEWEGKTHLASADGRDNAKHRQARFGKSGVDTPDGSLPPADPKLFLEHMDLAGVYSSVIYGPTRKWNIQDGELRLECYRAYNDYILELSSHSPERILGLPNLPTMDPQACGSEAERVIKLGARGVEFSMFDAAVPAGDPVWEPVWSAAEQAGIPICCHIGDKSGTPYPPNTHGQSLAHFSVVPFAMAKPIATVVLSGILERHPKLKFTFGEIRVGWLPFLVSWMDRQANERPVDTTARLSRLPSEYFARQITATFEDDLLGAKLIPMDWAYIADSAMWGCDYPHNEVTWPDPSVIMDKMFQGVAPALKRTVVFERAASLFKVKVPAPAS